MSAMPTPPKTYPPLGRTARLHPITGLLSKQGFADAFDCDLAVVRRYGMPMALVGLQIDLAAVEPHGAQVMDAVLLAASDALYPMFRASDKIGHLTGGHFVVSLLDAKESDARRLAEHARQALADVEIPIEGGDPIYLQPTVQMVMAAADSADTFETVLARLINSPNAAVTP